MSTPSNPLRRVLMLGTPLVFAVVTVFHPADDPADLDEGGLRLWMFVHLAQLVLTVALAYAIWFLLDGLAGRAAATARGVLPVFLVSFTAFDAVSGLATGWLVRSIHRHGDPGGGTRDAIDELFMDNWLTGNASIAGGMAAISWLAIAVASAVALRRAGADRTTAGLMAASLLFANHPAPTGTVGMLALFAAAWRWDRRRAGGEGVVADGSAVVMG